jgi:hypothetical protein
LKKLLIAAAIAAAFVVPAQASNIPAGIRDQIKAQCIADYPTNYVLQDACIEVQSKAYVKVHGHASTPREVPLTTADGADFRNSAYLSVAAKKCALKVGVMVDDYKVRGRMMNGHVSDSTINEYFASYVKQYTAEVRKDRKEFCATAQSNLHNFVADISQPVAE